MPRQAEHVFHVLYWVELMQGARRDQRADPPGQRMVGQRGDKDSGDDCPWAAQAGSEHEGKKLRLVADLGERDQQG